LRKPLPAHERHLIPTGTLRIDASEEGLEVLRRRFGGIGRSQRLEQWVGLYDVNLGAGSFDQDRTESPARSTRRTIPRADSPEHTGRTGDPVDGVRVRVDALTVENGTQLPSVHVPILQQDSRHDQ